VSESFVRMTSGLLRLAFPRVPGGTLVVRALSSSMLWWALACGRKALGIASGRGGFVEWDEC
jgi:hypothetical protein